jgi:hypothetical protein
MRQLLAPGTGQGTTGKWVYVASGGKRAFPARVAAVSLAGDWSAGDVIIEELIAGLPAESDAFANRPQTGVVEELGRIASPSGDLLIDKPVEFIRARSDTTANGFVGTVYAGIEMLE